MMADAEGVKKPWAEMTDEEHDEAIRQSGVEWTARRLEDEAAKRAERERILIIVPSVDSWMTTSLGRFFAQAVEKNADPDYPFLFSVGTLDGIRGYSIVRNKAAQIFLGSPCSRLWFIDADTIMPPDIFELPKVEGDIVTLPYPFVGTMCPAVCQYKDPNDFSKGMGPVEFDENGIADVNGTGMGCTIIKRSVLEDLRMRYAGIYDTPDGKVGHLDYEKNAPPAIFHYWEKPNGETLLGEDFDFCIRAKRLGYSVKLWGKSQCGHLKTVDLNEAWATVEAQLNSRREDTKIYTV